MEDAMSIKPSLTWRIGIGKLVGLLIGVTAYFLLPWFTGQTDALLQWGFLLWYATMGAFIGVFGVYNWHPILQLPMPWWLRAPLIGGWMNFVLMLLMYDRLADIMARFGSDLVRSPGWFVVEGMLLGAFIGWLATRFAGEGIETAGR